MQSSENSVQQVVRAAMEPFLGAQYGNPSSIHDVGRQAHDAMKRAREAVARLLGVEAGEIYFAPNADLANNVAILGRARFAEANELPKIFAVCPSDIPSIASATDQLAQRGWQIIKCDVAEQLNAQKGKACIHMDASSSPGVRGGRVSALAVETMTLSAATIGAPLQLAALVVRRGINLMPIVFGGGQEMGYFPGTEPIAHIVGFGAAADYWLDQNRTV